MVPPMKRKAHAKLNFYLDILGKRPDGYHNLRSIMQKIDLHDVLVFERSAEDRFRVHQKPMSPNNLVIRTVQMMRQSIDVPPVRIDLMKNIPIGAGLGGGSSDAATVILGLNDLFHLELDSLQMHEIASRMGSDVPFFLEGVAGIVEGTGTEISPLIGIDLPYLLLARPKGYIATPDVYRELKATDYAVPGDFETFTNHWKHGILSPCSNHLEKPAFRLDSRVEELKQAMMMTNPSQCLMTGSGNVVFAVFASERDRTQAVAALTPTYDWIVTTHTLKEKHDE